MLTRTVLTALLAVGVIPAAYAADDEVTALRAELERTKALVQQLEARLEAVESRAAAPEPPVAAAPAAAASPSAFNPAISAVLEGSFNGYSRDPEDIVIAGFAPPAEAALPGEGFSLGESEVTVSANVDPYFYGALTAALEDDAGDTEISLEEAYVETLALPGGTKIRAGRMFPVFGYLNEIHAHADAFVDRPLPYRAFLGADNFRDDGIQASVLLPTPVFAEVGGGWYRGIGYPAAGSSSDGTGAQTLFARTGGDVGASQSWVAGLSWLRGEADDRETDDLVFNGTTGLYAADVKYTWAPQGNLANQYVILQGEYLWRDENGDYDGTPYDESSSGWYAQAVWKLTPRWVVGYRYSRLTPPGVPAAFAGTALDAMGHTPRTNSVLLEWLGSEFSSLRLQYTLDDSGPSSDDEVVLRYTVSVGAHGAHQY